jgi:hypothetical protein
MTFIIFTDKFLKGFKGMTYTVPFIPFSFILIKTDQKENIGLIEHEKTHTKQHLRTFCFHPFLYGLSDTYKLKSEVEAYKVQDTYNDVSKLEFYAEFISTKYNLNVTKEQALKLLQ